MPQARSERTSRRHVLWIGDSVTRYSYIDYVYRLHHRQPDLLTPSTLLWERFHGNWTAYHQYSTAAFRGHMTCECFREGRQIQSMEEVEKEAEKTAVWPPPWVKTVVENRHYSTKRISLTADEMLAKKLLELGPAEGSTLKVEKGIQNVRKLQEKSTEAPRREDDEAGDNHDEQHTFLSYIGDHGGLRGLTSDIPDGFRYPRSDFGKLLTPFSYDNVDLEFAMKFLVPKINPTHLILNLGWWPHFRDFDKLERIFRLAREVLPETRIIWKGVTPASDGTSPPYAESEKRVYYRLVRQQVGFAGSKITDRTTDEKKLLTYVPYPIRYAEIPKDCFCDRVHFCCPYLYKAHNDLIREVVEKG
eukprot:g8003.t1